MIRRGILLGTILTSTAISVWGSPFDDLASPSQEVRTHAAQLIRDDHLYKATPRAEWDNLISGLFKEGDSTQDVIKSLQSKGLPSPTSFDNLGASFGIGFYLDDSWMINFTFHDYRLSQYEIVEEPKIIMVWPPAGYNGFWRTYRSDGSLANVYDYQNGRNLGDERHMSP